MGFPLNKKVLHKRYLGPLLDADGAPVLDAHGNETDTYADPDEQPVFGWEPPRSTEPALAGHARVVVDIKLYAPQSMGAAEHDQVLIRGEVFDVVGEAEDPNNNSWWAPGLVTVNLHRVEV
ncbi:hypothetical protein GS462_11220 [Rhodococcus hoagii]|nr:hypothetical protein [Prescottella equi]MBM4650982.1 hypothetical protein [Prescottella equi]MBM4686671.1 hypothetical protein [Prescottella equi]